MSNAIENHRGKFVTIPEGEYHGVYELMRTLHQVAPPERGEVEKCSCCAEPMIPIFDVVQQGFWIDHFKTYFACIPCKKAELFEYELSRIEPVKTKKAKKAK